jgi:hypothetical protein
LQVKFYHFCTIFCTSFSANVRLIVQKTSLILMAGGGGGWGGRLLKLMELFTRFLAAEAFSELTIPFCLSLVSSVHRFHFSFSLLGRGIKYIPLYIFAKIRRFPERENATFFLWRKYSFGEIKNQSIVLKSHNIFCANGDSLKLPPFQRQLFSHLSFFGQKRYLHNFSKNPILSPPIFCKQQKLARE